MMQRERIRISARKPTARWLALVGGALLAACHGDGEAPFELTGVDVQAVSAHNVRITWDPRADRTAIIERGDGVSFVEVTRRAADRGRFLDLGLAPDTPYAYRLRSCAGEQCSEPSEPQFVTTPATELPSFEVTLNTGESADNLVLLGVFQIGAGVTAEGHMAALDRSGQVLWEYVNHEFGPVTELQPLPDRTLATGQFMTFIHIDLDGSEIHRYEGNTAHHDIDQLSDGRFIFLTFDSFETIPGFLVSSDGIEILAADEETVEWSWLARDHIPITDVNEDDLALDNFGLGADWTHANAVHFDEQQQLVFVNIRNLDRLYAIDYPSGEVAWIMGAGGDFGEGLWSHSHDPQFLSEDRLLLFDNGFRRPGGETYSRVIEVAFDAAARQADIVWEYRETPDFYSFAQGACHVEENGNVFITDSLNGRALEVTRDQEKVWEMRVQSQWIYKAVTVPRDFFTEW